MAVFTTIEERQWYKRFHRSEFKGTHNNAMYKGVPFIIDGDSFTTGRRTIEHQFPQRDIPYSEDLGRAARVFDVNGMLLGDDYLEQRDKLVFICEENGNGELVHPYYGVIDVICKSITITNIRTETRVCKFQATFVETGSLTFPLVAIDTTATVEDAVEISLEETESSFILRYNQVKKQYSAVLGKQKALNQAIAAIYTAKASANMPATFFNELAQTQAKIDTLVLNGTDLVNDVLNLITFGLLGVTKDDNVDYTLSFEGLKESMDFESDVIETSDDTDLIDQLIQLGSVITMGLLLSLIDYVSSNDAKYYRDTTLDKLDELAGQDLDDTLMQALRDLRVAIANDVDTRSLDLPEISDYTIQKVLPALGISHTLYATVDQEQDIIDRNTVIHPAFVPAGEPLEVLLNA